MSEPTRRPRSRNQEWLLTLVPAFPLMLLVTRLWYLGRQNLSTVLLLVQYVSPLGLFSALLVTLVWVFPVVVLAARVLGALLRVSVPGEQQNTRSWLSRASVRIPDWVVALAVVTAALTWQLRYLPALLMLALAGLGLVVRERFGAHPWLVREVCVGLPVLAGVLAYLLLAPAGLSALGHRQVLDALLLLVPPAVAVLLTGPLPAAHARAVTHWPAVVAALLAPFLLGLLFLRAPILPTVALEVRDAAQPGGVQVLRGQIITVDDRMTTLLDGQGTANFVLNDRLLSKTLCTDFDRPPPTDLAVHSWPVEESALYWIARTGRTPHPTRAARAGR